MSHIGLSRRDAVLIGVSIAALIGITSFRLYEHFQISGVRARVHQAHDAAYYTGELIENLLDAETGQLTQAARDAGLTPGRAFGNLR